MSVSRWVGLVFVALGVASTGSVANGQVKLEWKAFAQNKPFYQQLKTNTEQKMKVMGMEVTQKQEQVFYFEWTPKGEKDGKYIVEQKITNLKMDIDIGGNKISYDSTKEDQPENPMTAFFGKLKGAKFTLTIDKDSMNVVKVEGVDKLVEELAKANQAMQPLLKQILSEDAVKQMANPVLGVVPGKEVKPGDTWERKIDLNMGPIGTYITTNKYTLNKVDGDKALIDVKTDLQYQAPKDAAGLPFQIKKADLKSENSGGQITFNVKEGLIDEAKMTVNLKGSLEVAISTNQTAVEIDQTQVTELKTAYTPFDDAKPAKKNGK